MKLKKVISYLYYALWVLNPFLLFIALFNDKLILGIYMEWLGKMHPLFLHFPIVIGIFICLYFILDKKNGLDEKIMHATLVANAFLSSIVCILGLFLSKQDNYDEGLIYLHQWGGIAMAMIGWGLIYIEQKNNRFKTNYIIRVEFSIAYLLLILLFTHKGAQLTHGTNILNFPKIENLDTAQIKKSLTDSNTTVYNRVIAPILQQKCVSCHGKDKMKGDLLLNSPTNILKGGKGGPILTFDKQKESILLERIHLDIAQKKHMPPNGKLQLTPDEISILKRWIKAGSDFKIKLQNLAKTDTLFLLANNYKPADNVERKVLTNLPDLKEFNSNYCSVNYLFNNTTQVEVHFFQRDFYNRADLKKLIKIQDQIVNLNMQGMPLTMEDIKIISGFKNVENLNLNYTGLHLKTMGPIKFLKNLKSLAICAIQFNNSDLKKFLIGSPLQQVHIWSSEIGKESLESLAAGYPKIKWTIGDNLKNELLKINTPTIEQDSSIITNFLDVKIKHLLHGITIRYTTNGVEPDSITSPIYKNTLRLTRNTNLKIKVFKPGWISSDLVQRNFYKSDIRPDSIFLINVNEAKSLGDGAKPLVDLTLGGTNFSNKKWVGNKDVPMKFVIQFNTPQVLHNAYFNSLINPGSYIFPIVSIAVEGSPDGKKYENIGETKFPNSLNQKELTSEIKTFSHAFTQNTPYKYYRFTVFNTKKLPQWHAGKGTPAWVFIDELFLN